MALKFAADRRLNERFACPGDFTLTLRVRGNLKKFEGRSLDFHRYGMAIYSDRPYPTSTKLILDIYWRGIQVTDLVCVVHNCTRTKKGYRCGLLFRTQSIDQFDQAEAENKLYELEQMLVHQFTQAQHEQQTTNAAGR